jgi:hypothetical protein
MQPLTVPCSLVVDMQDLSEIVAIGRYVRGETGVVVVFINHVFFGIDFVGGV